MKFLATTVLALSAVAAHADKLPVNIECQASAGDNVGIRFCSDLRDVVTRSPRYRLSYDAKEARFSIRVVTSDIDGSGADAAAITFTIDTEKSVLYVNQVVLVTGMNRTTSQAAWVLADLDTEVDGYLK